jgi:hypothetical protein
MDRFFRIFLRGEFLRKIIDGKPLSVGVYATIFIRADDEEHARTEATRALSTRLREQGALQEASRLVTETSEEVTEHEVPAVTPGLTWFREVLPRWMGNTARA